jgi:hypothetical protein
MYVVVAVVVYRYAGNKVSSPALGSAGKVVSKVAYGIAIPTVWPLSLTLVTYLLTSSRLSSLA